MTRSLTAAAVWLSLALAGAACIEPRRVALDEETSPTEHASPARLATDSAPAQPGAALEPGMLPTVRAAPVVFPPYTDRRPFEVAIRTAEPEPGHERRFGSIEMAITLRTRSPDLSQYPCTSCHLGLTVAMADKRVADAHQNIKPVHPRAAGALCSTCHAPDDVERLAVKGGDRPTLDQSYRLCAQCHSPQVESWIGGAHGKRLDGWQGRRVVVGCTDCHDPHNPTLEPRIPFRAPQIPTKGAH